ncbi:hypothetical protein AMAG_07270 [Allomyces macrogynus ATCC 38327]|uniref:Septin-type G domain-containing protein n=1 Tax=Allomyces macrogynus (strain ATCC 38327) TaxID=578462 RepID=A0A0L0SI43_ALLM3|nr:hypothetical protein AMAG_07270 [Allomyces macrogynus ATCC 38327]|eukprot:KNE62010.1 hypothetical protein AMAG_07270 [Allomyces macrogynus ATCC 38327]
MAAVQEPKKTPIGGYVGFDTIPTQIERKLLRRGFAFNVMLVGATGLGKSTLLNTLFAAHLIDSKGRFKVNEPPRQTTEIAPVTHHIEENGVRLKLTVIDTPGYADLMNNEHCLDPILKYIKDQYAHFLRKELTAARERYITDTRVHCVLFFINPSGQSLKPLDIVALRQLADICNVVPRAAFKARIKEEIEYHGIKLYPGQLQVPEPLDEYDLQEQALTDAIRARIPFARGRPSVAAAPSGVGSLRSTTRTNCEFTHLRNFLTRTHLQDLIETTALHYEAFRTRQLLALKENRDSSNTSPNK